jgi:hypothetical protein
MSAVDPAWLKAHPHAVAKSRQSNFKGYAATPGTGPAGETCKTCLHYTHGRNSDGRGKKFPKCGLMRPIWTHGPGTDIKASSPACAKFEPAGQRTRSPGHSLRRLLSSFVLSRPFMCDRAREAGITVKTVRELQKLALEHPSYWKL